MAFSDFWLRSNDGKKISTEGLSELKKSDLSENSALIRIFNIFDTQKADGTKGADGVLSKEELNSLFNTLSNAAKTKGNASIFETGEAEDFINKTYTIEGKTLKESGVTSSDLFDFVMTLSSKNNVFEEPLSHEEIQDLSIQTVTDDVTRARKIFNSQDENQGSVSNFVNAAKETFDTEFAASRVNRYLMREELCADLLEQSKSEEGLSQKEYLEAKINLAVQMLPRLEDSSKRSSIIKNLLTMGLYKGFGTKTKAEQERIAQEAEIELLKNALQKLTPEELTYFIKQVTEMPDAEYNEKMPQLVENMIDKSMQEKLNQTEMTDSIGGGQIKIKKPGSIEDIMSIGYKKMSFEETFAAERGVQYNSDNIMDYTEKNAKLQFLIEMHNRRQQTYNILHDATVVVEGNNKYGASDASAVKHSEEALEGAIIAALTNLYDEENLQEGLDKLGIPNLKIVKNEGDLFRPMKLVYESGDNQNSDIFANRECRGNDLVAIANKLQDMVDTNYQTALGNKTLDEYANEANSAYQLAYGARNAQHMAEAFKESQQEGVQTVKTVVQTGAMAVMIAGQLVPVAGQAAAAMTIGGLTASTVGGVGVSALENYTKAGGPTEKDKQAMLKELAESLAFVGSGTFIGKGSTAAFKALVLNKCPKLLAYASEVGIDAAMSLAADYAITGQINLTGEGIAQLQSILVGIVHAKGNFKSYLDNHAGKPNAHEPVALSPSVRKPYRKGVPEKLLNSTDKSDFVKLLSGIKDADGNIKFSNDDITKILENLPKDIEIKGRDIYDLMTLPDINLKCATKILSQVDSPEKLKVLNVLTDSSLWKLVEDPSIQNNNRIGAIEISYILDNLNDCKVSDMDKLLESAILGQYNKKFPGDGSLSNFISSMCVHIETDEQKLALNAIIDKFDRNSNISSFELLNGIISKISNSKDLQILRDVLDTMDTGPQTLDMFRRIMRAPGDEDRQFLTTVIRTVKENNTNVKIHKIMDIVFNLACRRTNSELSNQMILDMIKNKVDIKDITDLVQVPNNADQSHLIFERIYNNNKFDNDWKILREVEYDNDSQKQAFAALLDANEGNRFDALAIQDIIKNVKDENSVKMLNTLINDKNTDTFTIIESLKAGKIVEPPKLSSSDGVKNKKALEKQILEMIGFKKTGIFSVKNRDKTVNCLDNLVKLYTASPKRFKKMVDSGLFDLIKEGKIDVRILKNLDANTFLSNRTLSDIRKIRDGESLIKPLSSQADLADISKHVANGEVCELNGQLYVNDNGIATEIKLSKAKFEELFPPLTRISFEQGKLGDCWLVSTLDNFMDLPNGRVALYKLFEQQGDDILIKFPDSDKSIRFNGGKVLDAKGQQIGGLSESEYPTGIRMIEQAYAVHRYKKYDESSLTTDIMSRAANVDDLMNELESGWQHEAVNAISGKGTAVVMPINSLEDKQRMKESIKQYANDENTLLFFATKTTDGGDSYILSKEYDLAGSHAYSIKGYDEATGMVYITNPWNTSVVTEIPLYELLKYVGHINFARLN